MTLFSVAYCRERDYEICFRPNPSLDYIKQFRCVLNDTAVILQHDNSTVMPIMRWNSRTSCWRPIVRD